MTSSDLRGPKCILLFGFLAAFPFPGEPKSWEIDIIILFNISKRLYPVAMRYIWVLNILRIIGRSVSGLATDSPCGVWGRGWPTCLLHDSPLFGSQFKRRVGMYVCSDIWYIQYHFLPRFTVSSMKLVFFYSIITFFHIPSTLYTHIP